jgi:carbamoyl-phosphate synthase small subunit
VEGLLVLEDGRRFPGRAFGATDAGAVCGEVVFNTGMTGYQEVLTDPSYAGQIVVMTYPLVGNYGVADGVEESRRPWVRGFVVREACPSPSHWSARGTLDAYLAEAGILGLEGLDTRALVRHIRSRGTMRGVIAAGGGWEPERLAAMARAWRMGPVVAEVTTPEPYTVEPGGMDRPPWGAAAPVAEAGSGRVPHVVVVDYGAKRNILRALAARWCRCTVVPAGYGARRILELEPDGVCLSNGPGDPVDVPGAPETVRALLAAGVPVFGICLGHQILALALGGRTEKMRFGHRGVNHPVREVATGRCFITTQNHGYAVVADSLDPERVAVTHVNLSDGTVEGLAHRSLPAFSVQYHPEACPGPGDSDELFDRFLAMVRRPAPALAAGR